MRPKQFTLSSVKTTPTASLLLRYADGEQFEVSLVDTITQHPTLERLKDPKVFSSAKVGDHGASVIWANDDDLELAADNLRARAVEQDGVPSHARLLPQRRQARAAHRRAGMPRVGRGDEERRRLRTGRLSAAGH
jgi:hypothetical protein